MHAMLDQPEPESCLQEGPDQQSTLAELEIGREPSLRFLLPHEAAAKAAREASGKRDEPGGFNAASWWHGQSAEAGGSIVYGA